MEIDPKNDELISLYEIAKAEHEADNRYEDEEQAARLSILTDWMRDGGAKFDKLKVVARGVESYEVLASRDIREGETILFVPKT